MVGLESSAAPLVQLWRDGILTDVQVRSAEGRSFACHRIVLAAASAYFRAQLAGPWASTGSGEAPEIQLHMPASILQIVLEGIYTSELDTPDDALLEVLDAANYLGIPAQKAACCQVLRAQLKTSTAVSILAAADQHDCGDLYMEAHDVVRTHFDVISSSPKFAAEVQQLPLRVLLQLLEHTGLQTASEAPVLEAVLRWVEADPEGRSQEEVRQLLGAVRMPRPALAAGIAAASQTSEGPAEASALQRGHAAKRVQAALHDLQTDAAAPRLPQGPREAARGTTLVLAGGHDASWFCPKGAQCGSICSRSLHMISKNPRRNASQPARTVEVYDSSREAWQEGLPLPPLPGAVNLSFAGAASAAGQLCLVGGGPATCPVYVLQRGAASWRRAPAPPTARVHAALAPLSGRIHLLGGRSNRRAEKAAAEVPANEAFNLDSGTWASEPAMTQQRTALAAAALGGSLYALGGQAGAETCSSVEAYDALQGVWRVCQGSLRVGRKYCCAAPLNGRLYVVGGMTSSRTQLATMESMDPREGTWMPEAPMAMPRSSCGAAALQGRLFCVGGNGPNGQVHDSVEAYIPEAGKWLQVAGIAHARSSMALGVL